MRFDFGDEPQQESSSHVVVEGVIERLTFHAPDTGWTVLRLRTDLQASPLTAVGFMLCPEVGESVRLYGQWQQHSQYGRQLRFERYQLVRPATAAAIQAYLAGGLVYGIGPKMAEALVRHFGDATLDVLDKEPQRVTEVPGIGQRRAQALREAWARHSNVHRIMVFLHQHGIGSGMAARIYAHYGDQAIEVLEREPYRLAREVRGIGFFTADRIARSVGIAENDPARVDAAILHALRMAQDDGHLYLPVNILQQRARAHLGLSEELVELGLARLVDAGELFLEEYGPELAAYAPQMREIEMEVACRLRCCAASPPPDAPSPEHTAAWLRTQARSGGVQLSPEQIRAVAGALEQGACVITGGPGTGKTTVTRAIVEACRALGRPVALASPTGRAAKRLEQLAGHQATTIHRLLGYDPVRHGFKHGPGAPLPASLVILDEASMLDMVIARDVLRALPPHAQLVLIGDADQLPSVGPGSLLREVVRSGALPVFHLTQIFRQDEGSDIIRSAHLLNRGEAPRFPRKEQWLARRGDCLVLEEEDLDRAADRVVRTVVESLPKLGFSHQDIQVITPLHRGPIGVAALNVRLQEALNPPARGKRELARGETIFRVGDRVLQTINDYDRGVYNGDIGFVSNVDPEARTVRVEFALGRVEYGAADLDEIELAYALTVHKSQGSEYPAVVIVIHSTHYIMLQRSLLYTALTRAQRMAVIVGNYRGIWRAINNVSERDRYTRLAARLRGELPCGEVAPPLPLR